MDFFFPQKSSMDMMKKEEIFRLSNSWEVFIKVKRKRKGNHGNESLQKGEVEKTLLGLKTLPYVPPDRH